MTSEPMFCLRLTTPVHDGLGPGHAYASVPSFGLDDPTYLAPVTDLMPTAYRENCTTHGVEPFAAGFVWDFIPAMPGGATDTVTWDDGGYYAGLDRIARQRRALAFLNGGNA